ncbi:hypothetical protein U1Q18_033795 [Sarracenia purpurea var. burkii]
MHEPQSLSLSLFLFLPLFILTTLPLSTTRRRPISVERQLILLGFCAARSTFSSSPLSVLGNIRFSHGEHTKAQTLGTLLRAKFFLVATS